MVFTCLSLGRPAENLRVLENLNGVGDVEEACRRATSAAAHEALSFAKQEATRLARYPYLLWLAPARLAWVWGCLGGSVSYLYMKSPGDREESNDFWWVVPLCSVIGLVCSVTAVETWLCKRLKHQDPQAADRGADELRALYEEMAREVEAKAGVLVGCEDSDAAARELDGFRKLLHALGVTSYALAHLDLDCSIRLEILEPLYDAVLSAIRRVSAGHGIAFKPLPDQAKFKEFQAGVSELTDLANKVRFAR